MSYWWTMKTNQDTVAAAQLWYIPPWAFLTSLIKVSRVKIISQIGSNWALTAAHCVYNNDLEENFPASSLTVLFGIHNRTKLTARTRWHSSKEKSWRFAICTLQGSACLWAGCSSGAQHNSPNSWHCPSQIRSVFLSLCLTNFQFSGERVDLISYPPVCLPSHGQNFDGSLGLVYGHFYFSLIEAVFIFLWY